MSFSKIMRYVRNNGGVTLVGKGKIVKFDSGYQVSYTDNVCDNNYNTINFLLRRLCNGIDYTSVWLEDNMYYINKSLHIEDLREALQVAKEHNQLAIWDWKNNCSIYLKEVEI